jgi:hypothetical protein
VKRRKGFFSLTRTGERLASDTRAGELFDTLFRTHFRVLNLGCLHGVEPILGLQHTIAFSLHRFATADDGWRAPAEWKEELVLPAVRDEVAPRPYGDPLDIAVETRLLRPLEDFGLAKAREVPRKPGEWGSRRECRRSRLLERFLGFELGA